MGDGFASRIFGTTMMSNTRFDLKKVRLFDWAILGAFLIGLLVLGVVFYYPFLAERHYREGFNFDAAKRHRYAIEEFQQAIEYAPWESQYWMALGRAYESAADQATQKSEKLRFYKEALACYDTTVDLDIKNPWHYSRLGSVYLNMIGLAKDQTEADLFLRQSEFYTRKAAETDNQNPLFQLNLAYFLHRLGNFDEALLYYEKTLSYDDRFAEAYYNMADIYRRRKEPEKALQAYLNVLQQNPDFSGINVALSNFYMEQGDLAKAAPLLERELKQRPDYVEGINNLGAIYYQLKNWDRASELYEQLVRLYPGNEKMMLAYAQCLVLDRKPNMALAALEDFLVAYPDAQEVRSRYQSFRRDYR
jgi:tetratricopeptide (TPR) repeat protein